MPSDSMPGKAEEEAVLKENGAVQLKKGPFRGYIPADTYWIRRVGELNLIDGVLTVAVAMGFAMFMIKYNSEGLTRNLDDRESEVVDAIELFRSGTFNLNPLPPFGIQLLSIFPSQKETLRRVSLGLASMTLSYLYLTLRRVNTRFPLAVGCAAAVGCLPIFQIESISISIDSIQWFFLSMTLYFWRTSKCSRHFTKKWFINLLLLSVALGLGTSTKYIGLFTWTWVCAVSILEFWDVLGDPRLTSGYLTKYVFFKALMLGIIPSAVFITSLGVHVFSWTHDNPDFSRYMSPSFKSYLRGPVGHPQFLHYGSVITLRHRDSLGGYLHSHNFTYPGGSGEQQVTLSQEEDDYNNMWVVEPGRAANQENSNPKRVNDFGKIRLRHLATGKLLRASSAKPPISEQEYNSEISCTGSSNYTGDSDELWTVISVDDPLHSGIKPLKSVVKFLNEGQGCTMLAHDTKLPEWGFYQQEVLCLRSPTESRTLFEVESEQLNTTQSIEYETFTGDRSFIGFAKLLIELLQRQYKWNYYENKFKKHSVPTPEKWPFQLYKQKYVTHVWLSSVVYPVCFILYRGIQLLPWQHTNPEKTLNSIVHADFALECFLGWFLHYRPFTSSPHEDQKISSYTPSLFFAQLLVWKAFDTWSRTHLLFGAVICTYIAYVLHASR